MILMLRDRGRFCARAGLGGAPSVDFGATARSPASFILFQPVALAGSKPRGPLRRMSARVANSMSRGDGGRSPIHPNDVVDLDQDPLVVWQHKHYLLSVLTMAFVFPALVCGLWSDVLGGLVYAGIMRGCFVQQATFCINSLAHWLGDQPFDDRNSPRDNWITALVTLGEGYHNYHHEFPSDYRNGIEWYQYDPTKW